MIKDHLNTHAQSFFFWFRIFTILYVQGDDLYKFELDTVESVKHKRENDINIITH